MQTRELDRALIAVANTTDISGTATADEINPRGLRTRKERSLGRITGLPVLGSLMAAGIFVAVALMPARADEHKDEDRGREDNDKGIRAEITALKAQVAILQNQVNSLQTSETTLQTQLAAVQRNNALLLGPFVNVDFKTKIGVIGPNIIFKGANIHIVSGSGSTYDNGNPKGRGLGNLIIGYDEDPVVITNPLEPGDRSGSHNLVIGPFHRFTQASFGGLVAGQVNLIANVGASVTGGELNTASGFQSSVTGGASNTASGDFASVAGGGSNTASGTFASVLGGGTNSATGGAASVAGGGFNIAGGTGTVVLGGQKVTDNNNFSIAPQPPFP
jgi:hypothetical protein